MNKSDLFELSFMVNALITLSENANRVLNVIKAKYSLKDKSATIEFLVSKYIKSEKDPELRPEFIRKMKRIAKEPGIRVKDFGEHYGLKRV